MSASLFSGIDSMNKGLNASWAKNDVISSNIANIDTPNYKRRTVEFGNLLKEKVEIGMNRTNMRHMPVGEKTSKDVTINIDKSTNSLRTDGNNVNIDTEMTELAKNSLYYNVLTQKVSGEIQKIESAIKD